MLLLGWVGNTVRTGGDSTVKWYVHTHELPQTVNDSITRISSKQAIPIQDFQGFKSFGFLFAEACFQASKRSDLKLYVGMSREAKTTITVNDYWLLGIKNEISFGILQENHTLRVLA